jgi:hypothetical protein
MKNSFLVLGGLLVLINTVIGLVFSSYQPFNMILANVSLVLSTTLLYGTYKSAMADGFKIGFTAFFALTGLIRFGCAAFSPNQVQDNFAFVLFVILLAVEILCFFVGNAMKNK